MLLLIDAGNTRVKWALADGAAAWLASGSVAHAQLDRLKDDWRALDFERALISNVAGAAMRERLQAALPSSLAIEWFASTPARAGLQNHYRNPSQLGCDRFASAIGARALMPDTALIVATCGTATTIDAVSADGMFIGGMILPGLGLMASSLAHNTAQLPQVAQDLRVENPFADHTEAAIASGCLAAQAGAIERAVAAHGRHGDVRCILSGGAAPMIAPHLTIAHQCVDNLVLIGLQTVATHP
jgi:type III pantothenate kinase